jgi:hypothetical protein
MRKAQRDRSAQTVRDAAILLVLVVLALSVRFDLPGEVVEGALTHAGTETSDTAVADTTEQEDVSVLDPPTAPAVLEFRLPGTSGAAGERVRCIVVDDQGQARGARCSLLPADLAS